LGTTIEFYSADPQEFITLFSSQDEQAFFDKLKTYPVADFSFHPLIPYDMDRLCQSMRKQQLSVPPIFRNLLIKQVWDDGISESLTVIADSFTFVCAGLSETKIEEIAIDWSVEFSYKEPLHQTPAYKALVQLRKVAQDAVAQKRSLILHLLS
jgi:hypothetical protein